MTYKKVELYPNYTVVLIGDETKMKISIDCPGLAYYSIIHCNPGILERIMHPYFPSIIYISSESLYHCRIKNCLENFTQLVHAYFRNTQREVQKTLVKRLERAEREAKFDQVLTEIILPLSPQISKDVPPGSISFTAKEANDALDAISDPMDIHARPIAEKRKLLILQPIKHRDGCPTDDE
jgi:hypothetical protein